MADAGEPPALRPYHRIAVGVETTAQAALTFPVFRESVVQPLANALELQAGQFEVRKQPPLSQGQRRQSARAKLLPTQVCVVLFATRGCGARHCLQCSSWTADLSLFLAWMDAVPQLIEGCGRAAISECLSELLYMLQQPPLAAVDPATVQRHCLLLWLSEDNKSSFMLPADASGVSKCTWAVRCCAAAATQSASRCGLPTRMQPSVHAMSAAGNPMRRLSHNLMWRRRIRCCRPWRMRACRSRTSATRSPPSAAASLCNASRSSCRARRCAHHVRLIQPWLSQQHAEQVPQTFLAPVQVEASSTLLCFLPRLTFYCSAAFELLDAAVKGHLDAHAGGVAARLGARSSAWPAHFGRQAAALEEHQKQKAHAQRTQAQLLPGGALAAPGHQRPGMVRAWVQGEQRQRQLWWCETGP